MWEALSEAISNFAFSALVAATTALETVNGIGAGVETLKELMRAGVEGGVAPFCNASFFALDLSPKCVSEFHLNNLLLCSKRFKYFREFGTRVATTTVIRGSSFKVVFVVTCKISNSGISFNCSNCAADSFKIINRDTPESSAFVFSVLKLLAFFSLFVLFPLRPGVSILGDDPVFDVPMASPV